MSARKWILGGILVAVMVSAFKPDNPVSEQTVTPAPPPVERMDRREREALIKQATAGLKVSHDKIEKASFFGTGDPTMPRTRIAAYIAVSEEGPVSLRAVADYSGPRWIFVKNIKIMADDEIVLDRQIKRANIRRDNGSDWVIENFDVSADLETFIALQRVAESKSATVRYSGADRHHDHQVSKQERINLRRVLDAYAGLANLR